MRPVSAERGPPVTVAPVLALDPELIVLQPKALDDRSVFGFSEKAIVGEVADGNSKHRLVNRVESAGNQVTHRFAKLFFQITEYMPEWSGFFGWIDGLPYFIYDSAPK